MSGDVGEASVGHDRSVDELEVGVLDRRDGADEAEEGGPSWADEDRVLKGVTLVKFCASRKEVVLKHGPND